MNDINEFTKDINLALLPWWLERPGDAWGEAYLGERYIVADFETTNLEFGSALNAGNRLLNIAWHDSSEQGVSRHFQWGGEYDQKEFRDAIDALMYDRGVLVAHNAKFELQWLYRMGVDLANILIYDTMLGDYVLLGNRAQSYRLGLGSVAKRWGGKGKENMVDALIRGGVCPSDIPPERLEARVKLDVIQTEQIFRRQRRRLFDTNRLQVQFTRCIFTPVLAEMEMRGLALDKKAVESEYARAYREYAQAAREFEEFTGGVNPSSPPQMAHYLYNSPTDEIPGLGFTELKDKRRNPLRNKPTKQFPNGMPRTDTKTLDTLKATNAKQRKFIELRGRVALLDAELKKTLEFFKGVVDEYNGHFYGEFHQTRTKTHRLSSSGRKLHIEQFGKDRSVQFQNFKRSFKPLIGPKDPAHKILEIDGSGLEFRTAVQLGNDTQGKTDIRNDEDVHAVTASVINDVPQSEVTKVMRSAAKEHTFKPLYGGKSGTESEVRYYQHFEQKYHEIAETQDGWCKAVLLDKKLITPWGMRYYFPGTRMDPRSGYISNSTNIKNYPVQAFATAEIIPIAVTYLWHRIRANNLQSFMNNTVHDSVIIEAWPDEIEKLKGLGLQAFTLDVYYYLEEVYGINFDVPLGAGFTIGSTWASKDSTEWEVNVEADGSYWVKGSRKALTSK